MTEYRGTYSLRSRESSKKYVKYSKRNCLSFNFKDWQNKTLHYLRK